MEPLVGIENLRQKPHVFIAHHIYGLQGTSDWAMPGVVKEDVAPLITIASANDLRNFIPL